MLFVPYWYFRDIAHDWLSLKFRYEVKELGPGINCSARGGELWHSIF